jgi:hypothetical protein
VPRNNNVGPMISVNQSGVNRKIPGTLPPNLVTNGKGKGKEKAGPSLDMDELVAQTIAMDLEHEEDQEYYGAGLENVLASAGIATSAALPPPDHDPIDHNGVGVHVSGVSTKPIVVEDSLWGDPLENKKEKTKDEKVLLCDYHGKVCSRGICKVYEKQKQARDQRKKKEEQESRDWRGGAGGRGGRGVGRGARGRGGRGRDPETRPPRNGDLRHTYFSRRLSLNLSLSRRNRGSRKG